MVDVKFDRYYKYDELYRIMREFAAEYPQLVTLDSMGKSYEGRDIWLATVTNSATGAAEDKPAIWVHGNIHAVEVSTSSAALHLLYTLTKGYGSDERITYLLDTRTYYICPRLNPDGVEWALADKPKYRRSSTRPYPYNEDPIDGLLFEDIDGDGRILQMRIKDANGHWKAHPDELRLLIRRDPDEYGGTYYRVLDEGRIENYDGINIYPQTPKEGLDMNRNYPNNWRQDNEQRGAGPFPTSEPEVRAITMFVSSHNNICIATDLHTMSGVLLRPFANKPDSDMIGEDLWIYQKQGEKGKEIIGYPDMSIFHGFKYHPNQVITGGGDWMYEHLGMWYWAVEIWNPRKHAGIEVEKFIDWFREHPVEDELKLLKWSDEELGGKGYIDWYEFDHPQLGKVELGGWDSIYFWSNPVPHLLEKEIEPFAHWFIWQGLTTPKLELYDLIVTPVEANTYHIRMAVQNMGWLPSYCTKVALQKQRVRGVIAEIELPDGATLKTGKVRTQLGQLEGRSHTHTAISSHDATANTADRTMVEWVVQAPKGSEIKLIARHDRAGVVRETITL
jgi:murein tripeptide amidase MpaA